MQASSDADCTSAFSSDAKRRRHPDPVGQLPRWSRQSIGKGRMIGASLGSVAWTWTRGSRARAGARTSSSAGRSSGGWSSGGGTRDRGGRSATCLERAASRSRRSVASRTASSRESASARFAKTRRRPGWPRSGRAASTEADLGHRRLGLSDRGSVAPCMPADVHRRDVHRPGDVRPTPSGDCASRRRRRRSAGDRASLDELARAAAADEARRRG